MKKWIFRIAIILVVMVVAVVVLLFTNLNSIVKGGVEKVGPQITKTEMRLAKVNISPFSGSGQLTGLFVGNPEGYKTESAIKVGDVKVVLKMASVMHDTVEIESVNIQGPEITFDGGLFDNNLRKILDNVKAATGGNEKKDPKSPPAASGKKFRVQDVVMKGGKVHVNVSGLGASQSFDLPLGDIHLSNIGSDGSGVNTAELTRQLMEPLLTAAIKAVAESNLGKEIKDIGKGALDDVNKATKGIKDLFKK